MSQKFAKVVEEYKRAASGKRKPEESLAEATKRLAAQTARPKIPGMPQPVSVVPVPVPTSEPAEASSPEDENDTESEKEGKKHKHGEKKKHRKHKKAEQSQ